MTRGILLMRARGHHRRANVHHVSQYGVRRRRQEQLDWGDTDEAPVRTHGHNDAAVEGGSAHPVQQRPGTLLGPSHGHVANRVSGGGADRLVELSVRPEFESGSRGT